MIYACTCRYSYRLYRQFIDSFLKLFTVSQAWGELHVKKNALHVHYHYFMNLGIKLPLIFLRYSIILVLPLNE